MPQKSLSPPTLIVSSEIHEVGCLFPRLSSPSSIGGTTYFREQSPADPFGLWHHHHRNFGCVCVWIERGMILIILFWTTVGDIIYQSPRAYIVSVGSVDREVPPDARFLIDERGRESFCALKNPNEAYSLTYTQHKELEN